MLHRLPPHLLAIRDQHGRRVGPVLSLAQQVHSDHERIRMLVRHDEDLGRPREEVDPDLAKELLLGLGDEGVARPGDEVTHVDRLGPERHRGNRLHAAEEQDLIRACEVHRGDGRVRDLARDRWCAGYHVGDAGDLGRKDRHVCRCEQWVAATGDVAADAPDWDVLLAQMDARLDLELEILQRGFLCLSEGADIVLDFFDVGDDLFGDLRYDLLNLRGRELERGRLPFIELGGVLAHSGVAVGADVGDHIADDAWDVGVGAEIWGRGRLFLEVLACHGCESE